MEIRVHRPMFQLSGLLLLLGGLVLAVISFFWLPLATSTFCPSICPPPSSGTIVTAWDYALNRLAHWPISPGGDTFVLILLYFPLFAGAVLFLGSGAALAQPSKTLMRWLTGVWIAEIVLLVLLLLLIFFIIAHPDSGYWGLGAGALLSGIGLLLLRAGRPALRRAP